MSPMGCGGGGDPRSQYKSIFFSKKFKNIRHVLKNLMFIPFFRIVNFQVIPISMSACSNNKYLLIIFFFLFPLKGPRGRGSKIRGHVPYKDAFFLLTFLYYTWKCRKFIMYTMHNYPLLCSELDELDPRVIDRGWKALKKCRDFPPSPRPCPCPGEKCKFFFMGQKLLIWRESLLL